MEGVIGHVLPLRHPIQTAEEFAQLDVLSGDFIGGIVRGVPQEYVSSTLIHSPVASALPNPTRSSRSV